MNSTTILKFFWTVLLSAAAFYFALIPCEMIPEIPVDIDFKPFFVPLVMIALLPPGFSTIAVAFGAALGEGIGDIIEGYELDDPVGFVGYMIGFALAGYLIQGDPRCWPRLILASLIGACIQGCIEATTFLLFGEAGLDGALQSALGNTLTHGLIGGAIPLLLLVPLLYSRIERIFGFKPLDIYEEEELEFPKNTPIATKSKFTNRK